MNQNHHNSEQRQQPIDSSPGAQSLDANIGSAFQSNPLASILTQVQQPDPNMLTIRVKTMDQREFTVKVKNPYREADGLVQSAPTQPEVKVTSIKEAIKNIIQLDVERQRLIFQGKLMRDNDNIADFKIKNNQVIHLVARQTDQPQAAQPNQTQANQSNGAQQPRLGRPPDAPPNAGDPRINMQGVGNLDLVQEILRTFNETSILRRNRRLIFQQNARYYLEQVRFNQTESFDVLRRSMQDIQLLIDNQHTYEVGKKDEHLATDMTQENRPFNNRQVSQPWENSKNFRNIQQFNSQKRKFEIGMWIDVRDTIGQWLEAQVIQLRENQVFVHYNGWGVRWDEWIDCNSHRISVFRAHTVQNPRSNYLCPYPNVQPDSNQQLAQEPFGEKSLSKTLETASQIIQDATNCLFKFNNLRNAKNKWFESQQSKENSQGAAGDETNQINSSSTRNEPVAQRHEEEKRQEESPMDSTTTQQQRQNNMYLTKADHENDVVFQAAQLSPIMDRVGRMMIDLAPQLNNIVRQQKIKVQNQFRQSREQRTFVNNSAGASGGSTRADANAQRPQEGSQPVQNNNLNNTTDQPMANGETSLQDSQPSSNQMNNANQQNANSEDIPFDQKPFRIIDQVPIMHAPGEIAQVANLFDSRMFEDPHLNQEPNIEFHIHAFLNPRDNNNQANNNRQQPGAAAASSTQNRQNSHQEVAVGPDGLSSQQQSLSQQNVTQPSVAQNQRNMTTQTNTNQTQQRQQSTIQRRNLNSDNQIDSNAVRGNHEIREQQNHQKDILMNRDDLEDSVGRESQIQKQSNVFSKPNFRKSISKGFNNIQQRNQQERERTVINPEQSELAPQFQATNKSINSIQSLRNDCGETQNEVSTRARQEQGNPSHSQQIVEVNNRIRTTGALPAQEEQQLSTQSQWRRTMTRIFGNQQPSSQQASNEEAQRPASQVPSSPSGAVHRPRQMTMGPNNNDLAHRITPHPLAARDSRNREHPIAQYSDAQMKREMHKNSSQEKVQDVINLDRLNNRGQNRDKAANEMNQSMASVSSQIFSPNDSKMRASYSKMNFSSVQVDQQHKQSNMQIMSPSTAKAEMSSKQAARTNHKQDPNQNYTSPSKNQLNKMQEPRSSLAERGNSILGQSSKKQAEMSAKSIQGERQEVNSKWSSNRKEMTLEQQQRTNVNKNLKRNDSETDFNDR